MKDVRDLKDFMKLLWEGKGQARGLKPPTTNSKRGNETLSTKAQCRLQGDGPDMKGRGEGIGGVHERLGMEVLPLSLPPSISHSLSLIYPGPSTLNPQHSFRNPSSPEGERRQEAGVRRGGGGAVRRRSQVPRTPKL